MARSHAFSGDARVGKGPLRLHSRRTQPRAQAALRIRHHGVHRVGQQRQVGARVADVAEARRKPLLEGRELSVAGQVDAAVGGEHAGENSQMRGHALGQNRVRAGRQIDLAPAGVLLPQILQQPLIVGQVGDINRHNGRDVALERSLSLNNPRGKMKQRAELCRARTTTESSSVSDFTSVPSRSTHSGSTLASADAVACASATSGQEAIPSASVWPNCECADSKDTSQPLPENDRTIYREIAVALDEVNRQLREPIETPR